MRTAKYKILHFHFGKEGGAERFFVNLAQSLSEHDIEQRFVFRPNRIWENEVRPLGAVYLNHYRLLSFSSPFFKWKIGRVIANWQPDIILNWKPRGAKIIPKATKPVVITRFGDYPRSLKSTRKSDYIVANTPQIVEACVRQGWQGGRRTISNFPRQVTPNPIKRSALDTPDTAFVVCASGRFVPRKGFDALIKAVARHHKDAFLWLIGDGEERAALEKLAHDEGLGGRIRFSGWVSEAINYVAASDVFVMPSRHEPLGNVLLEAWGAGVPSISTKSEGPLWFARDKETALLVDIDDIEAMGQAICDIADNPTLGKNLCAEARKELEKNFSREAITRQYIELFAEAIERGKR